MESCKTCGDTGLIGQGENPAAHQGRLSTCPACNGTGKVSAETKEETPAEPVADPAPEETPVDSSARPTLGDAILGVLGIK